MVTFSCGEGGSPPRRENRYGRLRRCGAMLSIFLGVIAGAWTVLICLNAGTIGHRLRIIDRPDNHRKRHAKDTPLVGGVAILLPLLVWIAGALMTGLVADNGTLAALILCATG